MKEREAKRQDFIHDSTTAELKLANARVNQLGKVSEGCYFGEIIMGKIMATVVAIEL